VLAGSCLETAATVEELRRQARRDALTGIGNHSSFHERLRDLGALEQVALLVLDIDDFKQVNDTGGHLLGDQVLRATTQELQRVLHDPDVVFRIGGDEFAIILQGAHAATEARSSTECEIQRSVGPMLAAHGAALSVGAAHRRADEALIDTLERADAQLYLAKATKRPIGGLYARGDRPQPRPRRQPVRR
jgi:diguanylate cyclase (GGDEF)-like protein